MTVRLPRLLSGDSVMPESFSLSLPLRDTPTASMSVPDKGPSIAMHTWMELFTARGSVGLFRVTDMTHTSGGMNELTLRHGIDTLSDDVWADQTDFEGTVEEFLTAMLAQQTTERWQLGTCEYSATWNRQGINYTRLSDLLNELAQACEHHYFAFDFSTTPWTMSLLSLPTTVSAEFRLSRNVESASINRNDADMCNRLYLSINTVDNGKNSVEIKTYDNATSQALSGVVAKTADIDTGNIPDGDADAWAADFLALRAEPAVQITIDGIELAALTGDTWDEYDRGRKVQVALGDMGELVTERVESVDYPDVLGEPERVTVELANRLDAFSSTIAKLNQAAGRGAAAARAAARAEKDQRYWAMVVRDTDLENLYLTGIELDAQSGATIYSLAQGFVSQYAGIQVNREKIGLVVEESSGGNVIKAASIVAAINDTGSTVHINADKIYINGDTSISSLFAVSGQSVRMNVGQLYADRVAISARGDFQLLGYRADWGQKTVVTGITLSGGQVTDVQTETMYYLTRGQPV